MSHFGIDTEAFDPVTKRYVWPTGINATGRRMLFTGPDGITNQRVTVAEQNRYVGIGTMSPEGTSELAYLYRPDPLNAPSITPKHRRVGEIGWGVAAYADRSVLKSRQQITRGEFRQSAENRHTHLYQNPWTPPPHSYGGPRPSSAPVRSTNTAGSHYHKTSHYSKNLSDNSSSENSFSSRQQL